MKKLFVHLFTFYVRVSSEKIEYIIDDIVTLDSTKYRNMLLGICLKNMGIKYNVDEFKKFSKITAKLNSSTYKVGRVCTSIENITKREIETILFNLGHNLAGIYLKEEELNFLFSIRGK